MIQLDRHTRTTKRLPRRLRAFAVSLLVLGALGAPATASAEPFVPAALLDGAAAAPNSNFPVIIVGGGRTHPRELRAEVARVYREFRLIPAIAADVTGRQLEALARRPDLSSITPDAAMQPASTATLLWPQAVGADALWSTLSPLTGLLGPAPQAPAIAIVDSGIDPGRLADFGGRVAANVNLSSRSPGASGDENGHGTLVAGFAAGASAAYPGVAQNAKIVSLDVVDADGSALTSDVIAAADWIFANRTTYGIRVANFSLHSSYESSALTDPLAKAVRRLWLTGTVVVAAAGNDGPKRMLNAPASEPHVITVGAADIAGTIASGDDFNAPWTSYGHTADGFAKPELSAPGRYMVGPVPASSPLTSRFPERILAPGYMWMSGTSFAAPVVAGAAAQLLARHPEWKPDQVKGALMLTARAAPLATPGSLGVGVVNVKAAAALTSPPNPHENLNAFVRTDASGQLTFDGDAWNATTSSNASWSSASWSSASWSSASWSSASWSSASWSSAAKLDASWSSLSTISASWSSAAWSSFALDE